jgi:diguanylate cyclase (GGDEF)-like protein
MSKSKPKSRSGATTRRGSAKSSPASLRPIQAKPAKTGPAKPKIAEPEPARQSRVAPDQGGTSRKSPKAGATGTGVAQTGKLRRKAASKPSDSETARLQARLRRLTAQLAAANGRIEELEGWADTDFLLDILNRRGFERELNRAIAYLKRYHATGALIALDVDRLKPINDTFGHAAGDAVLKGIVNVILRHIRSSDVVGRLGGDEFVVLLWNLSEADALVKAAALEDAIDRLTFVFRGRSMSAGASTGVAVLAATDDAVAALERADLAMYARKKIRRDRAH